MLIEKLSVGPFQCNCSILACEETKEAVIVDPGDEAERILKIIEKHQLKPKYLLHTHAHLDHVGATQGVFQKTQGEVCLHHDDQFLYDHVAMQAALFNLPAFTVPPVTNYLEDKDVIKFGNYQIEVFHTPGHTPGSLSFYTTFVGAKHSVLPEAKPNASPLLFTGDTLFLGSIGRTDLWGGDYPLIIKSIKEKLLPVGDNVIVHPGHGPKTTIGAERRHNPFLSEI